MRIQESLNTDPNQTKSKTVSQVKALTTKSQHSLKAGRDLSRFSLKAGMLKKRYGIYVNQEPIKKEQLNAQKYSLKIVKHVLRMVQNAVVQPFCSGVMQSLLLGFLRRCSTTLS